MDTVFQILFASYTLLVVILFVAWYRVVNRPLPPATAPPMVTVIVPARNEATNIHNILADLARQDYPRFEVIVVDDHSTDDTTARVAALQPVYPWLRLEHHTGAGKKEALRHAIGRAHGHIIITTDADCRVGEQWLATMAAYFSDATVHLVFGGVSMEGRSFFAALQRIEFASLIGSGAATAELNVPTMCNGANLAFRRQAFVAVGGYDGNLHVPSGDDEFLMRKIAARFPGGVKYAAAKQAVVRTAAHEHLRDLVHQRIRWAGKWRHHRTWSSKLLAVFIFGVQLGVVLLPVMVFAGATSVSTAFTWWLIKAIAELVFISRVVTHLQARWSWTAFLFLQVIYPFYILSIGLMSNFRSFEWKGRRLKSLQVADP